MLAVSSVCDTCGCDDVVLQGKWRDHCCDTISVVVVVLLCLCVDLCLSSASSSTLGCHRSLVLSPHAKYVGVWVSEEFHRIHDGFAYSYTYSM